MNIYKQLWRFSYVLIGITILWAIWIFGFVWQYYNNNISPIEAIILFGLMIPTILLREIIIMKLERRK